MYILLWNGGTHLINNTRELPEILVAAAVHEPMFELVQQVVDMI